MARANNWRRMAPKLVGQLLADRRAATIARYPWPRAAHSMVQGWRIRLSRPPAKETAPVAGRATWKEFARWAAGVAATKASHARRSDWHLWATRRASGGSRYIPKGQRTW
jgi:hypothetical protein